MKDQVITFLIKADWDDCSWSGECCGKAMTLPEVKRITVTYVFDCASNALVKSYDFTDFSVS